MKLRLYHIQQGRENPATRRMVSIFDYLLSLGRGVSRGSTMVHCWVGCQCKPRLYLASFGCNFDTFWLGAVRPQFGWRGGRRWLKIDSSLVVGDFLQASHSNHRPISHHFRSAPTCHGQTDKRDWCSKRQHYALKCIAAKKTNKK